MEKIIVVRPADDLTAVAAQRAVDAARSSAQASSDATDAKIAAELAQAAAESAADTAAIDAAAAAAPAAAQAAATAANALIQPKVDEAIGAATSAGVDAGRAEDAANRIDLGALDDAVASTSEDRLATAADRVATGSDRTAAGAAQTAAAASAVSAGSHATSANADRLAAEAARDAAIAAGAWDYTPADEDALDAITGMAEDETALVIDTMHVWKYDGTEWVDTGESPLASKVGVDEFDAQLGLRIVGVNPGAGGSFGANENYYFRPATRADFDQMLTRIEVTTNSNRIATIAVCSVGVGNALTLVATYPIQLSAGLTVADVVIPVPAGCVVGVGAMATPAYDTVPPGTDTVWTATTRPATGTPVTVFTNFAIRQRMTLVASTRGEAHVGYTTALTVAARIGDDEIPVGWPDPMVATGSNAPNYAVILQEAITTAGRLTGVRVGVNAAGTATVFTCTIGSGPTATVVASQSITLAAGLNDVPLDLPVEPGQFVGIYVPSSSGLKFQNSTNPTGKACWSATSMPGTATAVTSSVAHRFEIQFRMATGIYARLARADQGGTGMTLMDAADPTGVADATAIAAAARAAHPNPYVRPGRFAVSAIPVAGDGFWGPGYFVHGGRRFILPRQPRVGSLYEGVRQRLAALIGTGAPLIAIGDSITHWSAATSAEKHWLDQLCGFANIMHSPGDLPIMTNFGTFGTYTPAFYGVTLTGSTSGGTRGPVGDTVAGSVVLAAGAAISFTGAFDAIGVSYIQEPGAGTLTVARGSTELETIDADGLLALDQWSGLIASGSPTSASYTITASGGPVEITSLLRHGVRSTTPIKRLNVMRVARGSYQFPDFTAAKVTSMLTIAGHLSASPPTAMIALGVNDAAGVTTAAAMKSRADLLISQLKAGGVNDIIGFLPMRPSSHASWNSRNANFDTVLAGLTQSYRAHGAQIIRPAYDLVASGLASDGLHPNDAGNSAMLSTILEALAA